MFFPIVAIIGILSPLAILTILWYLLWPKRPSLPIPKLPGVFGLTLPPIERLHLWLDEQADKLKTDVFYFNVPRTTIIAIRDPKLIRHIMWRRPDDFRRSEYMEGVIDEIGAGGLFNATGHNWKRLRTLLAPAFTKVQVAKLHQSALLVANRYVSFWKTSVQPDAKKELAIVFDDFKTQVGKFALESFGLLALGLDLDVLRSEGNEQELYLGLKGFYELATSRLNKLIPYWRWFQLPEDRQLMAGTEFVNNELDKIITQLKATREAEAKRKSLLDNVLNLGGIGRTENNEIHIDGKVQDLTHEELRSALLQFFIAGFETTATTLTWCVYALALYPQWQLRIRSEIALVCGDQDPTFEHVQRLENLYNFLQETMRIYSSTPVMFAEPFTPVKLTVGGKDIEVLPKDVIMMNNISASRTIWKDGEEFNPDRWRGDLPEEAKFFSSIGFGGGPRICIGRNMALEEMQLFLALLCRDFQIELSEKIQIEPKFQFTMSLSPRLPIRLTPV